MRRSYENELTKFGEIYEKDLIVCPYCGHEHKLNSDDFENGNEFEEEQECSECEQYFEVEGEVHFEFWATTKPLPVEKRK